MGIILLISNSLTFMMTIAIAERDMGAMKRGDGGGGGGGGGGIVIHLH